MTLEELAQVVRQTIIQATPLDDGHVIFAKQTAPRPAGSYSSIDARLNPNVGWGSKNYSTNVEDLTQKNTQLAMSVVSVQFMRDSANDYAFLFKASLFSQNIIDLWNANNIALVGISEIREVSKIISSSYEERFQADVSVMFEHSYSETVPGVDSVRVVGEIDNGSEKIADINIEGP